MEDPYKNLINLYQAKRKTLAIRRGLSKKGVTPIELLPTDALIPARDPRFFNKINKSGAVNIEVDKSNLTHRGPFKFDGSYYKNGISV